MLARPTRIALCELLLATAAAEQQAEIIRHLLCEFRNFHPYSAFKALEAANPKGSLAIDDLARLLSDNGFDFLGEDELRVFIALYDQD